MPYNPRFEPIVRSAAERYGLDPQLIRALIDTESGWNPKAQSPAGAQGLAQLMPDTAKEMGVTDPFDPVQSIHGGAGYLKKMLDATGDPALAVAAYNAGLDNVQKYGGIPPFEETQRHVNKVLSKAGVRQEPQPKTYDIKLTNGTYLYGVPEWLSKEDALAVAKRLGDVPEDVHGTYDIELADGRYLYDVPDTLTEEQALTHMRQLGEDVYSKKETEHLAKTGFLPAAQAGLYGYAGSAAKAVGEATGWEAARQFAQQMEEKAQAAHEPTTSEETQRAFEEGIVPGAKTWVREHITEPLGGMAGRFAPSIAAGMTPLGAPGFLGAEALAATGENIQRQEEQGREPEPGKAAVYGVAQAALARFGIPLPGAVKNSVIGQLMKSPTANEIKDVLAKEGEEAAINLAGGYFSNIAKGIAANAAAGTGMMAGTEALRRAAADQEVIGPEAGQAYLENAQTAATLAPILGGLHGVARTRAGKAALTEAQVPEISSAPPIPTEIPEPQVKVDPLEKAYSTIVDKFSQHKASTEEDVAALDAFVMEHAPQEYDAVMKTLDTNGPEAVLANPKKYPSIKRMANAMAAKSEVPENAQNVYRNQEVPGEAGQAGEGSEAYRSGDVYQAQQEPIKSGKGAPERPQKVIYEDLTDEEPQFARSQPVPPEPIELPEDTLSYFEEKPLTKEVQPLALGEKVQVVGQKLKGADLVTKVRKNLADPTAAVSKALAKMEPFDPATGKLRGDEIIKADKQRYNTIATGLREGIPVLGNDGTVHIEPSKEFSVDDINKSVDALKQLGIDRQVTWSMLRALSGGRVMRQDAKARQQAMDLLDQAESKAVEAQTSTDPQEAIALFKEAERLHKEGSKLFESVGQEEGAGREKLVSPTDVAVAEQLRAEYPELANVANRVFGLMGHLRQLAYDSGIISKDTFVKWSEDPEYIPHYKAFENLVDDPNALYRGTGTGAKATAKFHKLEGGEHLVDVLENIEKVYSYITAQSSRNVAQRHALDQLGQVGGAWRVKDKTKSDVVVRRQGKEEFWKVLDPDMLAAFENTPRAASKIAQISKPATSVLRGAVVYNPLFSLKQLIREPIYANFVSRTGLVTPIGVAKEFAKILAGKSKEYEELRRRGIVGAYDPIDILDDFEKRTTKTIGKKRSAWAKTVDWFKYLHEAADAATRVRVYQEALKEAKKRGLNPAYHKDFAANVSRNLINFSLQGHSQTVAEVRAMVPFFSASLNGLDTILRSATGANLPPAEKAKAIKTFWARAGAVTAGSLLYAAAMQDDEDYQKLPASEWAKFWLVKNDDGTFTKIPIPYEAGWAFKIVPELMIRQLYKTSDWKETGKDFAQSFWDMILPPMMPQAPKPMIEAWANKTTSGYPIEPRSEQELPVKEREGRASELAKVLSKDAGLHKLGLSPDKVEHIAQGYLADLWAIPAFLGDLMLQEKGAAPKGIKENPLIKSWLTDPSRSRQVEQFFDAYDDAREIHNAIIRGIKTGDREQRAEYAPQRVTKYKMLEKTKQAMSQVRDQIERVKNQKGLSSDEKEARIKTLQNRYSRLAKQAVE